MIKFHLQRVWKVALNPVLSRNESERNVTNTSLDVEVIGGGVPTPQYVLEIIGIPPITLYIDT